MTSQRKLEHDLLHADLAAVNRLLEQLDEEDVMARMGLEARCNELQEFIFAKEAEDEEVTASAILFFGGKPVTGTRGIESKFAAAAVSKFQDIVATIVAQNTGTLSRKGAVSNRNSSKLHITNIARGSVGFILEEMQPQANSTGIPLTTAVNETMELLDAFGGSGEAQFQETIEMMDQRVLGHAGEFFDLMRRGGATVRVVADQSDHRFGIEAVTRAVERARSTTTESEEVFIEGQLAGVLPDAHRFEFRCEDARGTITGKVTCALDADALDRFNREWLNVNTKAQIAVTRVFRNDDLVRESYTLLALAPASGAQA